jgi:hypothetical protein
LTTQSDKLKPLLAIAAICALAVSGCDLIPRQKVDPSAKPSSEVQTVTAQSAPMEAREIAPLVPADCAIEKGGFASAICASPSLKTAAEALDRTVSNALSGLTPETRQEIAITQVKWIAAQALICPAGAKGPRPIEESYSQEACLKEEIDDRAAQFRDMVTNAGPYRIVRITLETARTVEPVNAEFDARVAELSVSYPRIDAPKTSAESSFNDRMRPGETKDWLEYNQDLERSFEVTSAAPGFLGLLVTDFNMGHGAAHPNTNAQTMNYVLAGAAGTLGANDIFKPGANFAAFLTRKGSEGLLAAAKEAEIEGMEFEAARVTAVAADPKQWVIREEGLGIIFPSYSVAAYAFGQHEVLVPWRELAPLLKSGLPFKT